MESGTKKILIASAIGLVIGYVIFKVAKSKKDDKDQKPSPDQNGIVTVNEGSGRKYIVAPLLDIFRIKLNSDGTFTIHHKDDKNFKYPFREWKGKHVKSGSAIVFDKGMAFTEGTLPKNILAIEKAYKANIIPQSEIKAAEERARKYLAIASNPAIALFI